MEIIIDHGNKWHYRLLVFLATIFLSVLAVKAQEVVASGTVVDDQGEPRIGVTVSVKGTAKGVITDASGNFTLKVPAHSVISFSFVGCKPVQKKASTLRNARIVLLDDAGLLGEVVVVAYGTQRKETLTGSLSQVKSTEIIKSPVANMGQALTGRAVGVTTYQRSGQPGNDGVSINIRGTGTLNSSSPLVIVDGVERDFTQIDPSEVESMTILKDAASTAVYGIRGANGVIIVTTKQGVEGPTKVSFSANYALQQAIRMPESTDGVTVAKMYNEAKYNDDPTQNPTFSEDDLALYANGKDPLCHPNINWKDLLMNKFAFQQKYNLSVSGGTKNSKYYTSVSFFDQGGLMKNMTKIVDGLAYSHGYSYKRVNLRSNVDVNLTPTTTVSVQLGAVIGKTLSTPDVFTELIQVPSIVGSVYDRKMIILPTLPFPTSPLQVMLGSITDMTANTINTNIRFNQKLDFITKGLLLRGLASYDSYYYHSLYKSENNAIYRVQDGYNAYGQTTKVLEQAYETSGILPSPSDGWGRSQSMHAELALECKKTFGDHTINALLLGTLDKKWWAASQYSTIPISYEGFVGRLNYNYGSTYMLEVDAGYNGSENFAEGNRYALFPAVSAGWNIAEEKFFQKIISNSVISKLKFRVSYGLTGNDNTGGRRFMYLAGQYTPSWHGYQEGAIFGSSTQSMLMGYTEGKLGNPDVTWETAKKQNYGVDIVFGKDLLSLTAEYFRERRDNILATRSTDPAHMAIQGQDVYNLGKVKNSGFEIECRWNHKIENVLYYISANYSYAHNEIIEDGSIKDPNNPQLWSTGHSVGTRWGYVFEKFYSSQEEIDKGPNFGNPTIGEAKYVDVNHDGKIDSDDRVAMGYPEIPEINYGISMGFSYKGFDFSCLFQGAAHSTKMLSGIFREPFKYNKGIPSFAVDERWTPETAETAIRPKLTLAYTSMSYEDSNLWTRDGSYFKLRNAELAYTFNKELLTAILGQSKINAVRIYINGQNLLTWDKLKFVDPESNTGSYNYPQLRIFNLGMSLNF